MKSSEMWSRIEVTKQAIKRELAALSNDIGPEYDIDIEIKWATSGSSEHGVSSRAPRVEVSVSMETTSSAPSFWATMGSQESRAA